MMDWNNGRYASDTETWRFLDETFEIAVPGTQAAPHANWLRIARETMETIDQHHASACRYLDAFVDRGRFASDSEWECQFIEFGEGAQRQNVQFTLYYRIEGDEYGLWSVAFHATGIPAPDDLWPVRLVRQQH